MNTMFSSAQRPVYWLRFALLALWAMVAPSLALAQATVTYFHNDIAGTPLAATDGAGNLVWKESYRPYGERLIKSAASAGNKEWFVGKPQDARTGLVYMGARYYDPLTGHFMGVDPVGFVESNPHSFNRYAYANNNPYRYVDPDGGYAELAIEAVSLTMDFHSLVGNLRQGNWSGAALDTGGIIADVVGAALPVVPGVAGLGIRASREAGEMAAKGIGKLPGPATAKAGIQIGRIVVDSKGNAMIEPVGGKTVAAGKGASIPTHCIPTARTTSD